MDSGIINRLKTNEKITSISYRDNTEIKNNLSPIFENKFKNIKTDQINDKITLNDLENLNVGLSNATSYEDISVNR